MPFNRKIVLLGALLILTLLASACGYKKLVQDSDQNYGTRQKNDPKMYGGRMYGKSGSGSGQHNNRFVEFSSHLSREVTNINGIGQGIVMLTDRNAYVGIVLDATATHTLKTGRPILNEQDNGGWTEGVYNNKTGSDTWNNRQLVTPYNSYFSVNDHNELSSKLKQTIAVRVRKFAPAVQEVHITANRDVVNQFVEYAREAWGGREINRYIKPFNILVQKHFAGGNAMPVPLNLIKERAAKGKSIEELSGSGQSMNDQNSGSAGNTGMMGRGK
ncbi:sporulation lipoprotein, YhcN/YlaJ family [Paenibacillaceae bacterium GAS479]|nr:sporulation lipoprotein, YhcN/YlaJ family [Paenibacillaceae bacterium GAS479]